MSAPGSVFGDRLASDLYGKLSSVADQTLSRPLMTVQGRFQWFRTPTSILTSLNFDGKKHRVCNVRMQERWFRTLICQTFPSRVGGPPRGQLIINLLSWTHIFLKSYIRPCDMVIVRIPTSLHNITYYIVWCHQTTRAFKSSSLLKPSLNSPKFAVKE